MKKDLRLSSIRAFGILISFGIQVIFIKLIGASEYGVYVLFITWSAVISQILILGYDRFLIKELSLLFIQKEKEKFRYTLDRVLFFILFNCIFFSLVAFIIPIDFLRGTLFSNDLLKSTWIFIAVGSAIYAVFQLVGKILISTQRVELSYLRSEIIYKLILLLSVLLIFYSFKNLFGLNVILVGVLVSYTLTILSILFFDRKRLINYFKVKKKKIALGQENYVFFFLTLNYFLITQIDKIQLGRVSSMQILGIYGLAATLCNMTGFSVVGYTRLTPKMSYYINNNLLAELDIEFKKVVKNAVIIALPVMMFLVVFAEDVLLFFGESYVIAANALRILLFGQMVFYFTGPNGNLLFNGGHARIDMINSIIVLLLTILLNIIFYKAYGFIGVAIATSTGVTIMNILRVIQVKYYLNMFPYNIENIWLTIIAFISFGLVWLVGINPDNLILRLILNFSTGTIIAALATSAFYKFRGQTFIKINTGKLMERLKA
ncbi:lipopolysaccharide biosynthesis protein [Pontibacter locisalis]|uniref:Lipopolysaccharide biosynthesis protein n=1 Tax=Pontibacter locisalis TaxID=1719035 RepID=A0ABW5IHE5_9BACT